MISVYLLLDSPFVVKHRYSLSANLTLFRCAPTDADIRIGRRRHPHRSAQMSAPVDADIRIGRRRWKAQCFNVVKAHKMHGISSWFRL